MLLGKNDTSMKSSGPETSLPRPGLPLKFFMWVFFLCAFLLPIPLLENAYSLVENPPCLLERIDWHLPECLKSREKLYTPSISGILTAYSGSHWVTGTPRALLYGDMLQNGVSHRCACVKLSTKGRVSHHFGELLTSLKMYRAIWGSAAIVSQYRTIWGH